MTIGERVISDLIRREGGYVYHPADKGGPTKYGIIASTLGKWLRLGRDATVEEVKALREDQARSIYWQMYVYAAHLDLIDDARIGELLIDCNVQFGAGEKDAVRGFDASKGSEAVEWLQIAIGGLKVDGNLGPVTMAAYRNADKDLVFLGIMAERIAKRGRIVSADWRKVMDAHPELRPILEKMQAAFIKGWLNRDAEMLLLQPNGAGD